MVIYLDLVFLMNFILDFLLLLTVNVALKRYSKLRRLIMGAFFGSITLFTLFIPLNSTMLFIFKFLMSIFMCLISFGYRNLKYTSYNIIYLYMTSIILGGFLYCLKLEFEFNNKGFVFYYEGLAINYIFILLLSPIILYVFVKSIKALKEVKNYYYKVKVIFSNNYEITLSGFLDTGNKLKDPITNKPIILINKKKVKGKVPIRSPMYVPFNSLNHHGLLECLKPKYLSINDKEIKNYLIGFSEESFKLNGIDCLLNYKILEDI